MKEWDQLINNRFLSPKKKAEFTDLITERAQQLDLKF
jgi:hypothetical protein